MNGLRLASTQRASTGSRATWKSAVRSAALTSASTRLSPVSPRAASLYSGSMFARWMMPGFTRMLSGPRNTVHSALTPILVPRPSPMSTSNRSRRIR